jgi:hypothetical protein
MLPGLGWCELRLPTECPGLRTLAHSLGFALDIDSIPYVQRAVEFSWSLERLPWWEDETLRTVAIAGTSGSVNNTGGLTTPAIYTCTATATLAAGLSFTVGAETFIYSGARVSTHVLVVGTAAPRAVTLNHRIRYVSLPLSSPCFLPALTPSPSQAPISPSRSRFAADSPKEGSWILTSWPVLIWSTSR